jgi:hypothetical protein
MGRWNGGLRRQRRVGKISREFLGFLFRRREYRVWVANAFFFVADGGLKVFLAREALLEGIHSFTEGRTHFR